MGKRCRIVFVGGGSNSWTPNIVKDMFLTPALRDAEYVLLDINKPAADLNKTYLEKLARTLEVNPKVVSTTSRAQALKGANYVIITISTGGLKAMAHDLAIPEDYGIYHTVGDTSGPGGWARFLRNFGVFKTLGEDIRRHAPGAVVLNYTNPMVTLTDTLSRTYDGPVIGLCHGLFENLRFYQKFYKAKREDDIVVKYAGLNHFFWITEAKVGRRDIVADMKRRIKTQSFTDMLKDVLQDAFGFHSHREVATELFRATGVLPYLGDRHTCEYFPWYITNKKNMREYKIVRTSVKQRQKQFADRAKQLQRLVRLKKLDRDQISRSRETAADIVEAHWTGRTFIDVGNVPNVGQVSNLPAGAVLETAVRVDRNGFSPVTFGALPAAVQAMCEPWTRVYTTVVDACFRKDKTLALQALRMDPVCSHLNGKQVMELGSQLLKAHQSFIKVF
jgi:alpha-galactosidase/6-phospho-beta-glucosidase family protein